MRPGLPPESTFGEVCGVRSVWAVAMGAFARSMLPCAISGTRRSLLETVRDRKASLRSAFHSSTYTLMAEEALRDRDFGCTSKGRSEVYVRLGLPPESTFGEVCGVRACPSGTRVLL